MATISVTHLAGEKFQVETCDHVVLVDQPSAGGDEVGPTPVELLVMALSACAAHYAVGNLRKQGLPAEGLTVTGRWLMRAAPARGGRVALTFTTPARLTADQQQRLLEAVDRGTVHNTLRNPPLVEVALAATTVATRGGTR